MNLKILGTSNGGNTFNPHGWSIADDGPNNSHPCNMDIQVDWFGQCEMWIDYIRVDDNWANDLFNGIYDNTWIYWEVHDIAEASGQNPLKFYIEDFEFNNIPCIGYVNKKMMQISGNNYKVMGVGDIFYWSSPLRVYGPLPLNRYSIKQWLIDSAGFDEFYISPYPLSGSLPNTGNLDKFLGQYFR